MQIGKCQPAGWQMRMCKWKGILPSATIRRHTLLKIHDLKEQEHTVVLDKIEKGEGNGNAYQYADDKMRVIKLTNSYS